MRKFILMVVMLFMTLISVNAQIATENRKAFDNIYAGVEAGVATPLSFNSVFPLNTLIGVKVGKEFTPIYGLELEAGVALNDNIYNDLKWTNTIVKGTNLGLNGVINLSNMFGGYKGTPRWFEVKTNTGLGWFHYWNAGGHNDLSAKTGFDVAFNLGNKKAHSIVLSPGVFWNLSGSGKIKFDKRAAQFYLMASYVYHFKTSNGTHHFKTYDVGAMIYEIDRLNNELAKKPTEVVKYVEKVVEKPVEATNHATGFGVNETIFFAYDSAELDDRAKETLNNLGTAEYTIDGYASSEGSTEYNKELSQRRADAVKEYLEARGAKITSSVGHGVLFGTTTGRVVIVKTSK
jgi:outer membrane protein OmpA-like peptidoglycan-associated protein